MPSPGPANYNVSGKTNKGPHKPPAIGIYSRREKAPVLLPTPGPSSYSVESQAIYRKAPKYTFGSKEKPKKQPKTPGPSDNWLESEYDTCVSQGYTISGHHNISDPRFYNPGPGAYRIERDSLVKSRAPAYSMRQRFDLPSDKKNLPGPATYNTEKVTMNKPCRPAYSFGLRHSEYIAKPQKRLVPIKVKVPMCEC